MNEKVKLGTILFVITAVTGLVLGAVQQITAGPISKTKEAQRQEAFRKTLPEADSFNPVKFPPVSGVQDVQEGRKGGELVGYAVTVSVKGYAGPVVFVTGIGSDGIIRGISMLSQSETPGLGAKASEPSFSDQFRGKKAQVLKVVKSAPAKDDEVLAISGATITSRAVTEGVNSAVEVFEKMGGNR
ncbi:electron transport complex, RnfABCDGE type, G subunit [Thermanaerovibrio velox DSM 12556]|uniref:Ion-translocating oxidoreductase complex subunit G n=1 Tax=Thermanaerovibrio velox DSM 12556 TaxID=926567 RepID=H0UPD7_9BACT|nr:RnfABCDGE type electron transport complex subunit G [Thermanaerovibrio velox]EHM10568.1 electron transport complex, RnfABCDGE type, G subunit [Thermanaerovibrio velox DSM 12556]